MPRRHRKSRSRKTHPQPSQSQSQRTTVNVHLGGSRRRYVGRSLALPPLRFNSPVPYYMAGSASATDASKLNSRIDRLSETVMSGFARFNGPQNIFHVTAPVKEEPASPSPLRPPPSHSPLGSHFAPPPPGFGGRPVPLPPPPPGAPPATPGALSMTHLRSPNRHLPV